MRMALMGSLLSQMIRSEECDTASALMFEIVGAPDCALAKAVTIKPRTIRQRIIFKPSRHLYSKFYDTKVMQTGTLHHVGFIVSSIQKEIDGFQDSLQASWDGAIFHDPLQKVRVTFLRTSNPGDAQIELVEPAADDSPVNVFLKKGGGLHHLC